jgi:hypothetical protein
VKIAALAIIAFIALSTVFTQSYGFTTDEEFVLAQSTESIVSENLFDVDLLYAYVESGVTSVIAILNFTRRSNLTLPPDSGITEVYTVEIFSNGKLVRTTGVIGCIIGSGIMDGKVLMDLAISGSFSASGNVGLKPLKVSFAPILYPRLVEPISMKLIKLGWVTVDGNNTVVDLTSHETTERIELEKYQEGFLYNTLLPQEELLKIDLFNPLESSYLVSPTPSQQSAAPTATQTEPVSLQQPITISSQILIATFIVSISVACAGLFYYRKHKRQQVPALI